VNTLVVFGRSPSTSTGKTRLRRHVDTATADALCHTFFADILTWPLPPDTSLLLAVTEPLDGLASLASGATVHRQPDAGFGERLADAVDAAFQHGAQRVVVVGTDAPTLPPETLNACFSELGEHPSTLVPASDGGWVALGVDRPLGDALRDVPWSTDRTCRATEKALRRAERRPLVLPPWYDVDDAASLQQLRGELADRRAAARAPRTAAELRGGRTNPAWVAWLDRFGPWLIGAGVAILGLTISLLRFFTLHAQAYDLGFFDQVAWNTSHGRLFLSTFVPYSFLGEHWEPFFGVVAQLYRVVATPIWLMLVQALALGLAPIAAARLARVWLPGRPHLPVIAALAMACSPLLTNAAPLGFHMEAVTPAVTLFALQAAATRKRLRFVLLLMLLAAVKEDALLVAGGAGWIAWRADREPLGLAAAAAGVAGFLLVVLVLMPFFRGGHPTDLAASYAWLSPGSTSVAAFLRAALTHPGAVLVHLVAPRALQGWALAFLPLALLPLFSGWALLGALPPLLVALLSNSPWQGGLQLQYGLEALPLLLACALLGWRRLPPMPQLTRATTASLIAFPAAAYALVAPLPGGQHYDPGAEGGLSRFLAVNAVLDRIPRDAAVAATTGIVPHLSERTMVWEFPAGLGMPYVVLDDRVPLSDQSRPGYERARAALGGWHYRRVASADGVTLWAR
jgi:uncharacterized membrane protein/glycosyltransferase A (GT-A) superfamily protein (DUF2064 family)